MKKVISLVIIFILCFSCSACGSSKTSGIEVKRNGTTAAQSGDSEKFDATPTKLNIKSGTPFQNGLAAVHCNPDGQGACMAIIDTTGKIIFKLDKGYQLGAIEKNALYVHTSDVYKLLDRAGNVLASSEDGKFDKIVGSGVDNFLIMKHIANVDTNQYQYGVINIQGKIINELKFFGNNYNEEFYFDYFGNGTFLCTYKSIFYIIASNSLFRDRMGYVGVINGVTYFSKDNSLVSFSDNGEIIKSKYSSEYSISGNFLYKIEDSNKGTCTIINPATSKETVFSKYHVIGTYSNIDGIFWINVRGEDNRFYITALDESFNVKFDPIPADKAICNDGKALIYSPNRKGITIIDSNGNILAKDLPYENHYTSGISNDRLYIDTSTSNDSETGLYINSKGEVVIS